MAQENKPTSRQKIVDAYTTLVNKISVGHFDEFKEFFASEKDLEKAIQEFRTGLTDALLTKVNNLWDETEIDANVELLANLKKKAAGNTQKMWRPTGKSVSEQVRPLVVNQLKMSLKFYQLQLGFQKERTKEVIYNIETMRAKYKAMQVRRTNLLQQIMNEQNTFDSIRMHQKELDDRVNVDLII
ncbi:uncharacterized protein LOC128726924 [Anopheles nili]|uniref:uncharacterized protein LOC128726924 n=1 Tax=Anopheles nili TaxID=185578 RepID=UPI00237BE1C8|nr:uncharacterized protein LOC128726924 [Anopheles nili]